MDNEIEVLEPPTEEAPLLTVVEFRRNSQSSFPPAPPAVCYRWTQPTYQNPPITRIRPPPSPSRYSNYVPRQQYYGAGRQTNNWRSPSFGRQHSAPDVPVISNVVSLSPQKNHPVILKVESLSPLRGASRPQYAASRWNTPRLEAEKIANVTSLNPPRNNNAFRRGKFPSPIRLQNQRGVKRPAEANGCPVDTVISNQQPICIVLDDDDGDDPKNCDNNVKLEKISSVQDDSIKIVESLEKSVEVSKTASGRGDARSSKTPNDSIQESSENKPVDGSCSQKIVGHSPARKRIKPTSVKSNFNIEDFIKACIAVEDSPEMHSILEKKLRKHYRNCPQFVASSSCNEMIGRMISKVKNDRNNVYVYLAELIDELKARKGHGLEEEGPSKKKQKTEASVVDYKAVEEARTTDKIVKLNKTLKKLLKMIKNLEEKEVEWSEEEEKDSTYLMMQRYKARAVKVFHKLCDYTKESKAAGRNEKILCDTPIPKVNKCVERFIRETGLFPDFVDIHELIKQTVKTEDMSLSDTEIEKMARVAFTSVGEELQRQRKHDLAESLLALIDGAGADPAKDDDELNNQLTSNMEHWDKINKVIDEFADRANEKKTSGNQDGDKEEEDEEEEEEEDEDDEEENDDVDEQVELSVSSGEEGNDESETSLVGDEEATSSLVEEKEASSSLSETEDA